MNNEYLINSISNGEPFYPNKSYRNKLLSFIIPSFILISSPIILMLWIIETYIKPSKEIPEWVDLLVPTFLVFSIISILATLTIILLYVRSIKYSFSENEIIIERGIFNKVTKHIPFRTITHVSSKTSIFDRLFGIGSILIETAGKSGSLYAEPEGNIQGIKNFLEIRDLIMNRLRQFEGQYATTTELPKPIKSDIVYSPSPFHGDSFHDDMIRELRDIKQLLQEYLNE